MEQSHYTTQCSYRILQGDELTPHSSIVKKKKQTFSIIVLTIVETNHAPFPHATLLVCPVGLKMTPT